MLLRPIATSVRSNLVKDRMAVAECTIHILSPLAVANACVRRGRWADEQCAMHSSGGTLQLNYMPPSKQPHVGNLDPDLTRGSVGRREFVR